MDDPDTAMPRARPFNRTFSHPPHPCVEAQPPSAASGGIAPGAPRAGAQCQNPNRRPGAEPRPPRPRRRGMGPKAAAAERARAAGHAQRLRRRGAASPARAQGVPASRPRRAASAPPSPPPPRAAPHARIPNCGACCLCMPLNAHPSDTMRDPPPRACIERPLKVRPPSRVPSADPNTPPKEAAGPSLSPLCARPHAPRRAPRPKPLPGPPKPVKYDACGGGAPGRLRRRRGAARRAVRGRRAARRRWAAAAPARPGRGAAGLVMHVAARPRGLGPARGGKRGGGGKKRGGALRGRARFLRPGPASNQTASTPATPRRVESGSGLGRAPASA
jgi:translation initiation factor IF-2